MILKPKNDYFDGILKVHCLFNFKPESTHFWCVTSKSVNKCQVSKLDAFLKMVRTFDAILAFQKSANPLKTGTDIWYEVFIWCLFSSLFIYFLAAAAAFLTLRKHKFGRWELPSYFLFSLRVVWIFLYDNKSSVTSKFFNWVN